MVFFFCLENDREINMINVSMFLVDHVAANKRIRVIDVHDVEIDTGDARVV